MKKVLFERKLNKRLVGLVLGSAILGVGGYSMSPKGKNFWRRMKKKFSGVLGFLKSGLEEMKTQIKKNIDKKT